MKRINLVILVLCVLLLLASLAVNAATIEARAYLIEIAPGESLTLGCETEFAVDFDGNHRLYVGCQE